MSPLPHDDELLRRTYGLFDREDMELLRDLECPGCGPLVDEDDDPSCLPDQVAQILGGDENGFQRCPECGEELEPTMEAATDMLRLVAERHPEMAPDIAARLEAL